MSSIVSAIVKHFQAAPFAVHVYNELLIKKSDEDAEHEIYETDTPELKPHSPEIIKNIILANPELSKRLQEGAYNLDELANSVYWRVRFLHFLYQGHYIDIKGAEPLFEQAASKSKEIIEELIPVVLPKLAIKYQAEWKARLKLLRPIIDELLHGTYTGFKQLLIPLGMGDIPYENLLKYVYSAINKKGNDEAKKLITDKLNDLFGEELTEGDAEQWINNCNELLSTISSLLTKDEIKHITEKVQEIPANEINELLGLFLSKIQPSVVVIGPPFSAEHHSGFSDKSGWGNGYGKWIVTLGSAVITLGSYLFNEQKLRGTIFGLGTLGIGGVIASAFAPVRKILGFSTESANVLLDNAKGWGEGFGKWVVTGVSAVLAISGYYLSENKLKTLFLGLGTLGLGGVLASASEKTRELFGFAHTQTGDIDLERALESLMSVINPTR